MPGADKNVTPDLKIFQPSGALGITRRVLFSSVGFPLRLFLIGNPGQANKGGVMRLTATLFSVLLAMALVSSNAEARKHRHHHHHHHHHGCVAPDAWTMNNLAIAGFASLFAPIPVTIAVTSRADAAAAQVMRCAKKKRR
jgi:hypothetical protein